MRLAIWAVSALILDLGGEGPQRRDISRLILAVARMTAPAALFAIGLRLQCFSSRAFARAKRLASDGMTSRAVFSASVERS